jgi:proline iminopeptidase
MPRVTIEGLEINFVVRGSGPMLLAHPGGPGFDAPYMFSAELERSFTVVYLDPIGTGSSAKLPPDQQYNRGRDVAILDGLRASFAFKKVCVLGHSYGGYIAQLYALAYPERVEGLILYSTAPTTGPDWQARREAGVAKLAHQPWHADALRGLEHEKLATSQADLDAALALYMPLYFARWNERQHVYRPALNRSRLAFDVKTRRPATPVFDIRERLHLITPRTLVIAGEHDAISDANWSRELAQKIPNADLVVIPGAGHFAHIEEPDAFSRALVEFRAILRR